MEHPGVTARRIWLAVAIAFAVFAAGLVLALVLLFSRVAASAYTFPKACGSPVGALFGGGGGNLTLFGVPSRGPVTSCVDLLTRRTAAAVALILLAAVPLAASLLWALRWHLRNLAALREQLLATQASDKDTTD